MDNTHDLLADLQVFHGPVSPMRAMVYARMPSLQPADGYRLEGQVSGPWCDSTPTLPARSELCDAGPGPTLLARAVLPDPCPWSDEVPAVYRVRADLYRGSQLLGTAQRTFGFRNFGIAAGRLFRSGQPWTLRALPGDTAALSWDDYRQAGLAVIAQEPDAEFCQAAGGEGVPLLAVTAAAGTELRDKVLHWGQSVAVAAVVASGSEAWHSDPHAWAPNLLFVRQWPNAAKNTENWADGADLAVCEADHVPAAEAAQWGLPFLISRCVPPGTTFGEQLAALQQLETEMAANAAHAGYLIRYAR